MLIDQNGEFIKTDRTYKTNNYQDLKSEALKCNSCHLREGCTQVVMGEGAIDKKIMFIGEAPGATEDKKGRPFVGRAGSLLNKILSAVNIKRKNIYISNIIKCRPPENRKPTVSEAKKCSPILKAEFELINPKVIVTLGATALNLLIDTKASITKSRGKWVQKGKYYFLPTFHPAYLLRNKKMKKYSWYDFKLIKKSIERIEELKRKKEIH